MSRRPLPMIVAMRRPLLIALFGAALLCPTAQAQTATVDNGILNIQGTADRDSLSIIGPAYWIDAVKVQSLGLPVVAGAGCVQESESIARCDAALVTSIQMDLGAGNDVLVLETPLPTIAAFGPGDDKDYVQSPGPYGTEGGVWLDGGEGNDALGGGGKTDVLTGGPGDDSLNGRQGNDYLDPGAGQDTLMDLSGNDVIRTRDGERDFVDCGPGSDLATVDPFDRTRACELGRRRRPAR